MTTNYDIHERIFDFYDDYEYVGWTPEYSDSRIKQMLIKFLDKYGDKYSKEDLKFITDSFMVNLGLIGNDVRLTQIYSALGIYPDDLNPYIGYLNLIEKYFDIKCNILDVASGHYPAFANVVAKKQLKLQSGTITICDPKLVISSPLSSNMKIYKGSFMENISLNSYDLVTSILPNNIIDILLEKLFSDNKNFFIPLCNPHSNDSVKFGYNEKRTLDKVNDYVRQTNGNLDIVKLPSEYNNNLPILVYKSKNQ